jgi:glycosyltransferase involved in cell wall biosynthesis
MRICYIADGSSIHTQRWLNYFAQKGHQVHLITPTARAGYAEGVHLYRLVRLIPRIWPVTRYLSGLLWLVQVRLLVRRIKPDVIVAYYVTVNGYLALVSGFHPFILHALGSDILVDPKRNVLYRFLTKQALTKADHVMCVSPAVKKEVIRLGTATDKVETVVIGTDTRKFSPAPRDDMLRQRLGIPDSSPIVISVRSLKAVYDIKTLIEAIPLILKEEPEARFVIAGQGEQRSYLEKLAQDFGIYDNAKFVGWVPHDELPIYLASSDIYVSTSLSDGTSVSLLEAMACSLAPVVSNIPANQLWIEHGVNGFLFPVHDHEALAARINYLIKNAGTRGEFGKASRLIVQGKAEFETQLAEVERVYQELITTAACK